MASPTILTMRHGQAGRARAQRQEEEEEEGRVRGGVYALL